MKWASCSTVEWEKPTHIPDDAVKAAEWLGKRSTEEVNNSMRTAVEKVSALADKQARTDATMRWFKDSDPLVRHACWTG